MLLFLLISSVVVLKRKSLVLANIFSVLIVLVDVSEAKWVVVVKGWFVEVVVFSLVTVDKTVVVSISSSKIFIIIIRV